MLIVQLSNSFTERLDTSRGAVFTSMARDVDFLGPLEAALDLVVDLRCSLTQIRPCVRVLEVSVFVCAFGGPYYTGGSTSGVETGVGLVAFMRVAELSVDLGGEFCAGNG